MMPSARSVFRAALILAISGCGELPLPEISRGAESNLTEKWDFTVEVLSQWETSDLPAKLQKQCGIEAGAARGTKLVCQVEIPEAELFFGELTFIATAQEKAGCTQLIYAPFFYLESRSPTFRRSASEEPINCFGPSETEPFLFMNDVPKGCFNGPAPDVIQEFPVRTAQYTPLAASEKIEFSTPSANFLKRGSNRYTVNNLPESLRTSSFPGYIGSSMQDWEFICQDAYAEPVRHIVVKISDVDRPPALPGVDNFSGWPQE